MQNFLTIDPKDLDRFNPEEAVTIFRELIWAEANRLGLSKNLINIPTAINDSDGGIDAEIKNMDISGGQGLIKNGLTRYQIKTGKIKIMQDSVIKDILCKEKSLELKPRVKTCLDNNGHFIIVLFGYDKPDRDDDNNNAEEQIRKYLVKLDSKYSTAKIELWRQNTISSFFTHFPSLVFKLNSYLGLPFQAHIDWDLDQEMTLDLVKSSDYDAKIKIIEEILRTNDKAKHIRIVAEPGSGKTRFILEATRSKDIAPLVIYAKADDFIDKLYPFIAQKDSNFYVILVIDECNLEQRTTIWNKLANLGPRIKIISIFYEYEGHKSDIYYPKIPILSKDEIKSIISNYGVPVEHLDRWADLAGNSPRFAHLIGHNLKMHPDDVLKPIDNVYTRIIAGSLDPNSDEVKRIKRVLCFLALFKRFGYSRVFKEEAQAIHKKIYNADNSITFEIFCEIIERLREKKILQGENTLYITPKAFHIRMWLDWWNIYGRNLDFDKFLKDIPPNTELKTWYFEMLKYASASNVALKVVDDILGKDGPFQNSEYIKTEEGANFFLALSEASPQSALECLKKTIGTWSDEDLLDFTDGRRQIVFSLEKIVVWKDLFYDAANILIRLALSENESCSNNATGVFTDLFSPAYGRVAPTEASPQERFPILESLINSPSSKKQILAINACNKALSTDHFTRMIGAEYQGLKQEPKLWTPKTYGEIFDAYTQVWELLIGKIEDLDSDKQKLAIDILINNSRDISLYKSLSAMVINSLRKLLEQGYIEKNKLLPQIIQIIHYDKKDMVDETYNMWNKLKEDISGTDFSSLLERYIKMDIFEDRYEDSEKTNKIVLELAKSTIADNSIITEHLPWLVTHEAQNGHIFAYHLGKLDVDSNLLQIILQAQRNATDNASAYFLSGYLKATFESAPKKWEDLVFSFKDDKDLNMWIPEIVWRTGFYDNTALLVLELAENNIIDAKTFSMFAYGGVIKNITTTVFNKYVEFLISKNNFEVLSIVFSLYHAYYVYKEKDTDKNIPEDLTFRLLTSPLLFEGKEKPKQMDDHNWTGIAKVFILTYPGRCIKLAEKMFACLGKPNTIFHGFNSHPQIVLNEIAKIQPSEVWSIVVKYLESDNRSQAFYIKEWLRGWGRIGHNSPGILPVFPDHLIWNWIDGNIEINATYAAAFVPKQLFRAKDRICFARELLVRYGNRKDVRNELMGNFSSEGWSGPTSMHLEKKKQSLLDFKKSEDNINVQIWIDEYVAYLDKSIERALLEEERDRY